MKETVDYKAVLASMKKQRAALDQAIAAIEMLEGITVGPAGNVPHSGTGEIQPDTFVGLNIVEAASKFLHITGRPAKSTEAIAEALERGGLNCTLASVSALLRRANNAGEGDVIRVGRGLWGLQEWYPGRSRQ